MCGFAGFLRDPARPAVADEALLRRMLAQIAYRGPDETGIHVGGRLAFGHLRLAIIDLTGGHQPRVDSVTGDALLFNGEIYGYGALAENLKAAGVNLIDRSDTEVLFRLLQREGVSATLEKIDGMFTIAFYEAQSGTLHLARDRFGEKPLYYAEAGGGLVFGSEPRAVLAHPACREMTVDPGAVAEFLAFEYLPGPRSLRRGLKKLLPGHTLAFRAGHAEIRAYWRPEPDEDGADRTGESESQRLRRLDSLLDATVRDRLVADVPVGVFLSGGIDSSLVAAFVARHAPGLKALTVAVPGTSYDEAPAARALAQSLGLAHEVVALDEAALLEAFDVLAARMDDPLADSSLLPTWVLSRAARRHVTVALGGDGADELFAGYVSFRANRLARALAATPDFIGRWARQLSTALPDDSGYMSPAFLLRQLSHGAGVAPARQWAACMAPFAPEDLARLWRAEALKAATADPSDPIGERLAARGSRPWSTAELIHLFTTTYLPEDILQKVDRASMYVSLEVRAPYLGRAFAEYALSLPSRDKIRGLRTKHLFKKLALRHLPREAVRRRKHGFAVPMAQMLRGPLRQPVGEALLGRTSPLNDWFRRDCLERLWREHGSGVRDHRKKLWSLYCLATAATNTEPSSLQ